jgi:hypothetical protein
VVSLRVAIFDSKMDDPLSDDTFLFCLFYLPVTDVALALIAILYCIE